MLEEKKCKTCRGTFPISDYYLQKSNKDKLQTSCKPCVIAKGRDRYYKNRYEVLQHYSGGIPQCSCCKENRIEFLAIDHIGGGGRAHRLSIGNRSITEWLHSTGMPSGFRVLCHNCNLSRGFCGYCPHDEPGTPKNTITRKKNTG